MNFLGIARFTVFRLKIILFWWYYYSSRFIFFTPHLKVENYSLKKKQTGFPKRLM